MTETVLNVLIGCNCALAVFNVWGSWRNLQTARQNRKVAEDLHRLTTEQCARIVAADLGSLPVSVRQPPPMVDGGLK